MGAALTILGVRHHGPGSARMVSAALDKLRPDAVLIEGPPDAAEVLPMAATRAMKPPVALLVYEPESPARAAYYPFAEFSPEWQAARWGLRQKKEVRFIDLPFAQRPLRKELVEEGPVESEEEASTAAPVNRPPPARGDALDELARAAGMADGEAWWGRLIEERRGEEDPVAVFDAIRGAMGAARAELEQEGPRDEDEPAREAHMRRAIRAAQKDGYGRIAVVCGAWHAPVLTGEAIRETAVKADDDALMGLPKRRTTATWIPWTYGRLARFSGYGAGVVSPGWYEHLWVHHGNNPGRVSTGWLTRVARLMREEGLDASPGHIIEAVRLAESLAALRGRSISGLEELTEATLAVVCAGNPFPLRVIEERLIVGEKLGEVPEDAPAVPLQRDLSAQQRSLRLKVTADDRVLDLDQRKELDLDRSRLLHRLTLLGVDWGTLQLDQRQKASTFHEIWKLQWKPELAVSVIEAAQWGNTVQEAASNRVADRAARSDDLPMLTSMLDHVLLAGLPAAVRSLIARIQALSAVAADMAHLMRALPPVARVLRYGNVRKTDAALVEPVVAGLLARVCAGLLPACASLDDDAARTMRENMDGVESALATLDRPEFAAAWRERLAAVGDADIHGLVGGRAWRILLDAHATEARAVADRLSLALSRGNDAAKAAAWLEGFLSGSGTILVHDETLRGIVDGWVGSLSSAAFEQVAPLVRRTFSTFQKPERRAIGEAIARGDAGRPGAAAPAGEDYDPARGELVMPVLRAILGEELP